MITGTQLTFQIMLEGTPNKRWLIIKPDKLPQNAPAQSEAQKARQAIPRVQQENTLNKKGCRAPSQRNQVGSKGRDEKRREGHGECKNKKQNRIYPCCKKLSLQA